MLKEEIIMSFKIALGIVIASLVTKALNMEFYSTASTILIISMLSTKKQSIKLSGTLLLAAILSLGLASFLFTLFGYSLGVFALYILIFSFLMYRFDTEAALIANVVLVSQIYSLGSISFSILLNQLGLMLIGLTIAFVLNIFTLDFESELIEYQKQAENLIDSILQHMGRCLNNECDKGIVKEKLEELDLVLSKGKARSYEYLNSFYIKEKDFYVEYFIMRKQQYYTLVSMQEFIKLKFLNKTEVKLLREFTDNFENNTQILGAYQLQMERLDEIKYHFTHIAKLPTTNMELQNRIALHKYLYGLVSLVEFKIYFMESHGRKD